MYRYDMYTYETKTRDLQLQWCVTIDSDDSKTDVHR